MHSPKGALGELALPLLTSLVCVLGCSGRPSVVNRPTGPLDLDAARDYVLALVNRDRHDHGLPELERDKVAERAAQEHADDMARFGYTAHWGTDGSVPEERYTLAGGEDFVQENAACFGDGVKRELVKDPTFTAEHLERIEGAFMAEVPPADGHRRNILKDTHTNLGIGLAQPAGIPEPCMAQEFVDERGDYQSLPKSARRGSMVRVAGRVTKPVEFGGVGISRIEPRKPRSASDLNRTSTYPIPEPYILFFPKGFRTPKPVTFDGKEFSIDVPLNAGRGRYGVSVWGRYPGAGNQLVMVSLRTIDVK
ncbi:MAG: CAP domain-containing protein [Myxococcota bacterium]